MKGWSKIRKKDKEEEGSVQAKEPQHWPVLFWVRGGDKTGEQCKRAHEGIRRGWEPGKYTIAQRMFSSCVQGWNRALKSVNGGWSGRGELGSGLSPLGV